MFRATAILAILASAAAFAPMGRMATSSALKMSFESELGAQPPLGFWDPLGLLNDADQERFDRLRTVETKHGRISMLAILGHLVTISNAKILERAYLTVPKWQRLTICLASELGVTVEDVGWQIPSQCQKPRELS